MLSQEQFLLVVLDAFQHGIDSSEVVAVMKDTYKILVSQESIEQMYAYFEIAIYKPTIH